MAGILSWLHCTVYPKKYAHGFCFAVLCCGYTLTDYPISIRLTSLALWQSNDCPSASKATLMNMDKYFMWIHYERLHNHNKAKQNKTVCIFLGIYCIKRDVIVLGIVISVYTDVIMNTTASQITDVSIVFSTVCSGADQRKHQSYVSLAFVRGINRWQVNSPYKGPVTRKMFPFDWWRHHVIRTTGVYVGIHRSPVAPPHKEPVIMELRCLIDVSTNKSLNKQLNYR